MTKHTLLVVASRIGIVSAVLALAQSLCAQTVRLHGATSLDKLLKAQQSALESQTGLKLELVGNGAGRGLVDLCAGRADVGLIGGSLQGVAEAMNAERAGSVVLTGLKEIPVTSVKLVVITHPGVGVKALTLAQLSDVLSGKVANWKEVGGADQAPKVVLAFPGDGARITTRENVLKGGEFVKGAIQRNTAKDLCVVVAQLPGAVAVLSEKNVEGNVTVVGTDQQVLMPMQFVVKGEPTGETKKVIEAAKTLIK